MVLGQVQWFPQIPPFFGSCDPVHHRTLDPLAADATFGGSGAPGSRGRDDMMRVAAAMMALLVCGVTTAATINVPADYTTIQAEIGRAHV